MTRSSRYARYRGQCARRFVTATVPTIGRSILAASGLVYSFGLGGLAVSAETSAEVAKAGCKVQVEYEGKLSDGTVFSTTEGGQPISFVVGAGSAPLGLDTIVDGMQVGQTKAIQLSPSEAFGEYDSRAVFQVPLDKLPKNTQIGSRLSNGQQMGVVTDIQDSTATVDLNHPLAGQTLHISLTLVSSEQATNQLSKTILKPGDGVNFPKKGDRLSMHYTGRLASNGQKFDSSVDRGQPFSFRIGVGQVIRGWDEGVMKMSLGEKARLYIPSDMGYGSRGAGRAIPPNADLEFDVELLKIN